MGREAELFKYVESNNVNKVKKLVNSRSTTSKNKNKLQSTLKKFRSTSDLLHVNKRSSVSSSNGNISPTEETDNLSQRGRKISTDGGNSERPSNVIITHQEKSSIDNLYNLNWKHPSKGTTPLLQATLLGYYDMVDLLLQHGADPNVTDNMGNTALHLAVFTGRSDIMELLLNSKIKVNVTNADGNTALHLGAQQCSMGKKYILMKLLKAGARMYIQNESGLIPLDLAVLYDRYDGVSVMLECDTSLYKRCNLALIEASVRGNTRIIQLLLQHRTDPNQLNLKKGTRALHEAVRFLRYDAAELLLSHGADMNLKNSKMETPHSILSHYTSDKAEPFYQLLKKYCDSDASSHSRRCNGVSNGLHRDLDDTPRINIPDEMPMLVNDISWTQNTAQYCSSCTAKGANTNILDGNPCTFWTIPSVSPSWVMLDMREDYIITGIRITGWKHPNMIKHCQLQAANTPYGPWSVIHEFTCTMTGSDNPLDPGTAQDFDGCKSTSRYWRLWIRDNHGGECMCFQGVDLYGCQLSLWEWYEAQGLAPCVDRLLEAGCNTVQALAALTDSHIWDMVGKSASPSEYERIREVIMDKRLEVYPMTELHWQTLPVSCVIVGKPLPDFTVTSSPNVYEELEVVSYTSTLSGCTRSQLVPRPHDKPSVATFQGVIMDQCGNYLLEVRSVRFPWISIRTKRQTRVVSIPAPISPEYIIRPAGGGAGVGEDLDTSYGDGSSMDDCVFLHQPSPMQTY